MKIPDPEYPSLPSLQLPSEFDQNTPSAIYPPLKPLRKQSISLSNLLDDVSEYLPSQESASSILVPHHKYDLRHLPSRRPSTTDTSTLNLPALSNNSALRLARQHAQLISSDTHSTELVPQSYFTSGLIPLRYFLLTFKLQSFTETYSLKF